MGLINDDSFDTPYGTTLTNTYIAIADHDIRVTKSPDSDGYVLSYSAGVWVDLAARNVDNRALRIFAGEVQLTNEQLPASVYQIAYNDIKGKYTNTRDV